MVSLSGYKKDSDSATAIVRTPKPLLTDSANVPLTEVLIEHPRLLKHGLHIRHLGHVPF
jgi:hypothetical protein